MIRRLTPNDAQLFRDLRILALTDSPDAFESFLENEKQRLSPDREHILRPEGNAFFVFEQDDVILGLIGSLAPHGRGTGISVEASLSALTNEPERR